MMNKESGLIAGIKPGTLGRTDESIEGGAGDVIEGWLDKPFSVAGVDRAGIEGHRDSPMYIPVLGGTNQFANSTETMGVNAH